MLAEGCTPDLPCGQRCNRQEPDRRGKNSHLQGASQTVRMTVFFRQNLTRPRISRTQFKTSVRSRQVQSKFPVSCLYVHPLELHKLPKFSATNLCVNPENGELGCLGVRNLNCMLGCKLVVVNLNQHGLSSSRSSPVAYILELGPLLKQIPICGCAEAFRSKMHSDAQIGTGGGV